MSRQIHEVCLLVVGSIIVDGGKQSVHFSGQVFVDNVVLPNLTSSGNNYTIINYSFNIVFSISSSSHWSVFVVGRKDV